ncbi:hypothetical protein L596_012179 [Steinernema carpocapsae]|uniref:Uncharacterized protein n=1 Tax=Steinernema carpocapsae TaxID=34508 RepID=A0A4U5NX50_STECR|nr:hypothetical protein L596_012179 [Steinernema carpocapsae]
MTSKVHRERITAFFKSEDAQKIFAEYAEATKGRKRPRDGKNMAWMREAIQSQGGPSVSKSTMSRYWNQYMWAAGIKDEIKEDSYAASPKLLKTEPLKTEEETAAQEPSVIALGSNICNNTCFHCREARLAASVIVDTTWKEEGQADDHTEETSEDVQEVPQEGVNFSRFFNTSIPLDDDAQDEDISFSVDQLLNASVQLGDVFSGEGEGGHEQSVNMDLLLNSLR